MAKEAALEKNGVSAYDIGMMRTSNFIQDLAQAYGERCIIDCCIDWLASIKAVHDKKVMETVFRVFGLDCLKRDLGWYVKEKVVKPQAGANLIIAQNSLIKDMAINIADLVQLLNVPDKILQTPLT